jgi:hypothetical protein
MDVTCGISRKNGNTWKVSVGSSEGDRLEGIGVKGRILVKYILNKRVERRGMNSSNSG